MKHCMLKMLLALSLLILVAESASAQIPKDLVKPSLVASATAVEPGKPIQIGVLLQLAPKWHVYWKNVGDAGIPTTVKWTLPEGFTVSELQFPVPRRFEQPGGIEMFGYSEQVMLIATITPPAKIDVASVAIGANVNWLVCDQTCIPGNAKLSVNLPVGAGQPSGAEVFATWNARLPVPAAKAKQVASQQASLKPSGDKKDIRQLTITVEWAAQPPAQIEWFPPASSALVFSKIRVDTAGKTTTITAKAEHLPGQMLESGSLDSVVAFAGDNGRSGVAVPVAFDGTGWQVAQAGR